MTYTEDFLHVIPSKLFTPADTLNISDRNQNKLTTPLRESDDPELD